MNATRKRLKKKALQQTLDDIVKGILVEYKGNGKQIVLALITAKKDLKDAGANPKELKKFQDKIDEYMTLVKKEKKRVEARKRTEQGIEAMTNKKYKDPEEDSGEEVIMLKKPKKRLSVFAALSQGKKVPPPGFAGGRKTKSRRRKSKKNRRSKTKRKSRKRKSRKRKSRKRNSRKKRGGSACRAFSNDCNGCINNNTTRCVFNSSTKECSKQTLRKRASSSWSRSCDINDLPLAEAVAEGQLLRVESLGGTPFVEGLREGSRDVPIPGAVDAGISLEERARRDERSAIRRLQLRNRNGTVNNNSTYEGTPCFTQCEHKGWCEAGVKGACDWENYCYPSNNSGDAKMGGVDKQYCDKPESVRRPRYVGDGRVYLHDMDNILPFQGGRKKKSRKRKSRKRKSRKRKSRKKKGGATCSDLTECSRCVSYKKRNDTPCLWNKNKTPKCRSRNRIKGRENRRNGWTNNCSPASNVERKNELDHARVDINRDMTQERLDKWNASSKLMQGWYELDRRKEKDEYITEEELNNMSRAYEYDPEVQGEIKTRDLPVANIKKANIKKANIKKANIVDKDGQKTISI